MQTEPKIFRWVSLLLALLLPMPGRADFLYSTANGRVTITGYSGTTPAALVIPATINGLPVVSIGEEAFESNTNLINLNIGTNVISIGLDAFAGCYKLSIINLPNSLTDIDAFAFYVCSSLTNVTIPDSVTNLGFFAFEEAGLKSVIVGANVGFIGGVFTDDGELQAIYFRGNAAPGSGPFFSGDYSLKSVHYQVGTLGWGTNYGGLPTAPYSLVINGGFDDTGDFFGWSVSGSGSATITGPNVYSGRAAADFTEQPSKLGATTGVLSQTLPTQPGAEYVVSFAVNGIANGACNVSWNNTVLVDQAFATGWTRLQYVVTAQGADTLQFTFPPQSKFAATTAIDSVTVTPLAVLQPQINAAYKLSLSTYVGIPVVNYALDRTTSLALPINWTPQVTNLTDTNGVWSLTNMTLTATNNFWRLRSVP